MLGDEESNQHDSFSSGNRLLEFAQYTRPREFRGHAVPEVLLSGNHEEIARWRQEQSYLSTRKRRSDLLETDQIDRITRHESDERNEPMSQEILKLVEKTEPQGRSRRSSTIGDTVDVHTRILEGEDERIQIFSGTVIARSGSGSREMFTVRRIVAGEGVERKFPLHSPKIAKIDVKRSGVTRRAKLYYLRDRVGKAVQLRERKAAAKEETTGA